MRLSLLVIYKYSTEYYTPNFSYRVLFIVVQESQNDFEIPKAQDFNHSDKYFTIRNTSKFREKTPISC